MDNITTPDKQPDNSSTPASSSIDTISPSVTNEPTSPGETSNPDQSIPTVDSETSSPPEENTTPDTVSDNSSAEQSTSPDETSSETTEEKPTDQTLADAMSKKQKPETSEIKTNIKVKSIPKIILTYGVIPAVCVAILIVGVIYFKDKIFKPTPKNPPIVILTDSQRKELLNDNNARQYLSEIESAIRLYYIRHNKKYPPARSFAKMIKIIKKSGEYNIVIADSPNLPPKYIFRYCSSGKNEYLLSIIKSPKNYNLLSLGADTCTPKP